MQDLPLDDQTAGLDVEKTEPEPVVEDFGATVWSQAVWYVARWGMLTQPKIDSAVQSWHDNPIPEPTWPEDGVALQDAREAFATEVWYAAIDSLAPPQEIAATAKLANPYDSTPLG